MLNKKEIWKKYLENLNHFLDSDDKEISSYISHLNAESEKVKLDSSLLETYKKIPYIDTLCAKKLDNLTNSIENLSNKLTKREISLEDFRQKLVELSQIDLEKENVEIRKQINYIKDKLIEFC